SGDVVHGGAVVTLLLKQPGRGTKNFLSRISRCVAAHWRTTIQHQYHQSPNLLTLFQPPATIVRNRPTGRYAYQHRSSPSWPPSFTSETPILQFLRGRPSPCLAMAARDMHRLRISVTAAIT